MGWDLIISRFQNAKLPLWCHQSRSSVWRLLETLAWTIHPPSLLLEYIESYRQYWLQRGLLQPAYIYLVLCIMVACCCSLRDGILLLSLSCPMEGGGLHPTFQIVVNLLHSFIDLWISRPFLQGTHAAEGIGTVSLPSLIFNNIQLYLQSLISSFILKKLVVQTMSFPWNHHELHSADGEWKLSSPSHS